MIADTCEWLDRRLRDATINRISLMLVCHPEPASIASRAEGSPRSDGLLMRQYYIYIMSNRSQVLYIGVTNDLENRVAQHQRGVNPGFTRKYHLKRLVYFESYVDIGEAIGREKQLKGWRRERKIGLIESLNPKWSDLSREWIESLRGDPSTRRLAQDDTQKKRSSRSD